MSQSVEPQSPNVPDAAAIPSFLPPSRRPSHPRRPSPSPSLDATSDLDDEPGSEWADETPETMTDTSSPVSTSSPRRLLDAGTRKAYEKTAAKVAVVASALVESRVGGGSGAFLMGEDEADAIAAPASRLAARHAPLPGGGQATDLADCVELFVAVVGYVLSSLARRADAFTGRGIGDPNEPRDDDEPGDEAPPPPAPAPAWPSPPPAPVVGLGS